ncbi:NAD(P)H-binding protein [Nonomuraea sp. NPDC049504]|uniref:NmrA family NAD(P)-binding protein n=1 Tax=Nonomuraea sp. NPDC049504 TaxID=3154729 RepID=UPI00341ED47F
MILVTGATGTIGSRLVALLAAEGAKVRAVTRGPQASGLPANVDVVVGDPSRPGTMVGAMEGVTSLFLHPRAVGDSAAELCALARERGAGRVVALAAINVDEDLAAQPSRFQGDRNKEVEDAAVASGMEWASLRAASFAVNTLHTMAPQVRAGDVVRGPYAAFAEPLIHEEDLAEVAARALLDEGPAFRKMPLTGPQALSHEEMATVIGEVIGRPLRYQEIPPEAYAQGMVQRGFPQAFVAALLARYARGAGPAEAVTDEVAKILGRPARTYADWVADHATAFRGAA